MSDACLEDLLVNKDTAALAADEVTIGNQGMVCRNDRIPGNVELLRQLATRRQFHAGGEGTVENTLDEFLPNLVLQIHRTAGVEIDNGVLHRVSPLIP